MNPRVKNAEMRRDRRIPGLPCGSELIQTTNMLWSRGEHSVLEGKGSACFSHIASALVMMPCFTGSGSAYLSQQSWEVGGLGLIVQITNSALPGADSSTAFTRWSTQRHTNSDPARVGSSTGAEWTPRSLAVSDPCNGLSIFPCFDH